VHAGRVRRADARWDTWRICEFAEILGFYGLQYWYTWQVSVLGLGPIWMSDNEAVKQRAARALEDGGIFAFGLSEQAHGADIYSTDMVLTPRDEGVYSASGRKYYIGNGNQGGDRLRLRQARRHRRLRLLRRRVVARALRASAERLRQPELRLRVRAQRLSAHRGRHPAQGQGRVLRALNTVNIGKYNLGWASIGICTHALYEAIAHAHNRRLYKMRVTDFPHVKRMFVDAYARLVAMKLFALRACDYMRSASAEDRRYLLYNPMVKMKVTTEGERVINLLWDVIAAKGFEKNMYFEQAAVDIRGLPKLEGTVHVNIALIVKFMPNYFFAPAECPDIPRRDDPADDAFLFAQGPASGLGKIRFHDYHEAFAAWDLPNVRVFAQQVDAFRDMLASAPPNEAQMKDTDFLLAGGELFALVVYAQLILENARLYTIDAETVDQIFDFMVRDFAEFALQLHNKASSTPEQMQQCLKMIAKPATDERRTDAVWATVLALDGAYEMNA
jgi:acyl-CoA dehydrogenase